MTRRDTYIVTAIAVLGAVGAFWFLALSPKREKLSAVGKDVAAARQELDQAKQEKIKFAQDQIAFPRLYASLGRLGKAVPADDDVPSLLVQLNHAAAQANVNFHSVELKIDQDAAEAAAAARGSPSRRARPRAKRRHPRGGERRPDGTSGRRPLDRGARLAAAPGADPAVTAAATGGLKTLKFEYKFKGDFFKLEDLIHNITRTRRATQPGARSYGSPDLDQRLHDEAGQASRSSRPRTCFPLTRACSRARRRRARPPPRRRRPPAPGRPPRPLRPPR